MSRTQHRILNSEQGFTLIEIIAVLVILGILAAVAVPKFIDLQNEARIKSAESAISEVKARLSTGYGMFLLRNGVEPADIAAICGANGVNDPATLPTAGTLDVPVGADYTVVLGTYDATAKTISITVSVVQGETITPNVVGTWAMP
jgi:prepilin-type N-terminal cleavage/methylation domain-containing protein